MHFRIADTFTASLAKLTGNEQKAAKTTALDLLLTPALPGLQFHKLHNAPDPRFGSVRASRDVRIIVHRIGNSLMLCYVDHHDSAYQWAERRKVETHPKTGAAQLVEVRKTVQEITVPSYAATDKEVSPKPPLFSGISENDLLSYGVPAEWLDDVRNANEDNFLELTDHLPSEAAEALLELAYGGRSRFVQPATASPFGSAESRKVAESTAQYGVAADPFEHPDAKRRFRLMSNVEELERASTIPGRGGQSFFIPDSGKSWRRTTAGPFRVAGAAGTGKTIVAIHRAVFLARTNPDARVLLTTISDTLADALQTKLRQLIYNEPRLAERLEVDAIDRVAERLFRAQIGTPKIATREMVRDLLTRAAGEAKTPHKFSPRFLLSEWENVVDAWQLDQWEGYRDLKRLGRKTRFPVEQRSTLWSIFERVKAELRDRGLQTRANMFSSLAATLKDRRNPPNDFVIVDEAQDVSVAQLRFLAALGAHRPNGLFFSGDLGQRIFQTPFSWKALGVDVRGRSQTLKLNYRTSHQIRKQADRLLGPKSPMSMAISKIGGERSRPSMANLRQFTYSRPSRKKVQLSPHGCGNAGTAAWLRGKWRYSCARGRSWTEHAARCATPGFLSRSWMNAWRPIKTAYRSAPCTWRKDWSSAPLPSWPVTTRLFRCRSASKPSRMMRISKKSTTRKDTCSTSPAPVPGTT